MLKAMIVDDDLNVAACLRALIPWSDLGYQVAAEASNGAEGLTKLMDIRPDVVITDLKMPVMDGAEFCRRIREVSDDTAIIFLSAYESFATAQLALRCGVTEYILKPINTKKIEQLTEVLASLAKSYHNRDFFHRLINSRELADQISDRIRCGDAAYFEKFFQEFVDCSASDFTTVQEASLKLINLLYDYLQEVGMEPAVVEERRQRTLEELRQLQKKMDKVTYTSKLFFDLLQFHQTGQEDYYHLTMERIKKYIEANAADPSFSVAAVADKFSFSADYVGKIFSKYTGMTINAYLANLRLERSLKLLRDTEVPINDIAGMVGYSSPNYFARVFKKQMDQTPTEYRTRVRLLTGMAESSQDGQ